jgi:hypothetical protein
MFPPPGTQEQVVGLIHVITSVVFSVTTKRLFDAGLKEKFEDRN